MDHALHITANLAQFSGSETCYRSRLNPKCVYTEGVQYLAESAECYWLLDLILLAQAHEAVLKATAFQVWDLTVQKDSSATLTCSDGDGNVVRTEAITWTDFPLRGIQLWFANDTLYLPSEH